MVRWSLVVALVVVASACGGSKQTFSPPGTTSGATATGSTSAAGTSSAGTTTSTTGANTSGTTTTGPSSGSGAGSTSSTSSTSSGSTAASTSSGSGSSATSSGSSGATTGASTTSSGSTGGTGTVGGSSGSTSGGSTTTGGSLCGTCTSTQVCCVSGPCAGTCEPDCRLGGSCPANNTCDASSGLCLPSGSSSTGGSTTTSSSTTTSGGSTTTSGGSTTGGACGTCPSNDVCCSSGPCTGQCVPDCRLGGSCPANNTCDTSTGMCMPSGSSSTTSSSTTTSGGSTTTSGGSTGGSACGTCPSNDVCCGSGPCTGQCVPDCRLGGSCPSNTTCDASSGVCVSSGSSSTTSSSTTTSGGSTTTSGGSTTGGGACGTCPSNDVCCTSGPCTGQCVPDCRLGGSCPANNTCDTSTGLCMPTGSSSTSGGSTTSGSTTTSGGSTTSGGGTTTGTGCGSNADCALPTGVCDVDAGACVECLADGDCGGSPFTCETASDTCWRASCDLTAHTEPSGKVNSKGCDELLRDTTPCMAERLDAGISGPWLKFSCLITLKLTTNAQGKKVVEALSTGMPDHKSVYFDGGSPCYETDTTRTYADPYMIASRNVDMLFEYNPTETNGDAGSVPTMGLAVDGVQILNDSAGPNTNIYTEVGSFDRCGAHPQSSGAYHYHTEPYAITQDDDALVGVARDGYFIYGRRDPDGSEAGAPDGGATAPYFGHVGVTIDSSTPVFHYHVHYEQDGGASAYFVAPWQFYGKMGSCPSGCN